MRRSNRSILQQIANASIAVSLGAMTFLGGAAHAETVQQRAQAEMNKGLDYFAAQQAASREVGPVYAPELSAQGRAVEAAMNLGKDYFAAVETTSQRTGAFSPEQVANAQLAQEQLNQGKDYVAAWSAADNELPARIEASPSTQVASERDVAPSKY